MTLCHIQFRLIRVFYSSLLMNAETASSDDESRSNPSTRLAGAEQHENASKSWYKTFPCHLVLAGSGALDLFILWQLRLRPEAAKFVCIRLPSIRKAV